MCQKNNRISKRFKLQQLVYHVKRTIAHLLYYYIYNNNDINLFR